MSNPFSDKIEEVGVDIPKIKQILAQRAELGAKVKQCVESDGFQILKAIFKNYENDTKSVRYPTFEQYNSKMDALEIVRDLLGQFESFVNDAEQAVSELNKITESESSTPSLLSLDGEGTDNEEGQDS